MSSTIILLKMENNNKQHKQLYNYHYLCCNYLQTITTKEGERKE